MKKSVKVHLIGFLETIKDKYSPGFKVDCEIAIKELEKPEKKPKLNGVIKYQRGKHG